MSVRVLHSEECQRDVISLADDKLNFCLGRVYFLCLLGKEKKTVSAGDRADSKLNKEQDHSIVVSQLPRRSIQLKKELFKRSNHQ